MERGRCAGFEVEEADDCSARDGDSRWGGEEALVGVKVGVVAEVMGEAFGGVGSFDRDEAAWVLDLGDRVGGDGGFEDRFAGLRVMGGDVAMAGLFGGGHGYGVCSFLWISSRFFKGLGVGRLVGCIWVYLRYGQCMYAVVFILQRKELHI